VNIRRWRPDRGIERGPLWIVLDLVVAYLSAVIAIGPSDFTASVMDGPVLVRAAAAVWFLAIAARRFAPATALWGAAAATVAVALADVPVTNASLASALAVALVVQSRPARTALELSALPVTAVLVVLVAQPDALIPALVAHVVAIVVGRAGRVRWEASESMRRKEIEHERERADARARQALTAERARMARELHDAVGHAVTVMVTHAGAARLALGDAHDEVASALGHIERVGRGAMTDLDGILGLLAQDAEPDGDLGDALRALAASMPPGVTVELRLPDDPAALSGIERDTAEVVHRVVQEALTNVIRHAGPAHAIVDVELLDTVLSVTISDNGRSPGTRPAVSGGGRGLRGMRERVAALGGECEAGPLPDGGWRVAARMPGRRHVATEDVA
jgi:signal transduction histidine kinase